MFQKRKIIYHGTEAQALDALGKELGCHFQRGCVNGNNFRIGQKIRRLGNGMQMHYVISGKVMKDQQTTVIAYVVSPDVITTAFISFLFPLLWIHSLLLCIKGTGNWAFFGAAIFIHLVFAAVSWWKEKRLGAEFERAIKAAEEKFLPEET